MGNPFIIAEDLALKTLLSGITVSDDSNASRPVKAWFGYPDVEVRDQTFPFITIDLIDIMPGNAGKQIEFLICNLDCFLGFSSFGYITGNKNNTGRLAALIPDKFAIHLNIKGTTL